MPSNNSWMTKVILHFKKKNKRQPRSNTHKSPPKSKFFLLLDYEDLVWNSTLEYKLPSNIYRLKLWRLGKKIETSCWLSFQAEIYFLQSSMLIRNLPSQREQPTNNPCAINTKNSILQTVCVTCFKKLRCFKSVSLKMYQPGIVKKIPILKISPRLQYFSSSIFSSTC